jgi:hypothetical protein
MRYFKGAHVRSDKLMIEIKCLLKKSQFLIWLFQFDENSTERAVHCRTRGENGRPIVWAL